MSIRRFLWEHIFNQVTESLDLKNIDSYDYKFHGIKEADKYNAKYAYYSFFVEEINETVDVKMYILTYTYRSLLPPILRDKEIMDNGGIISLDYTIRDNELQFKKSNYKVLIKILKTVMEIGQDYMKKGDVHAIVIGASEKDSNSNQKITIYHALSKFKPNGWVDTPSRKGGFNLLILYDPKKF